MKPCPITNKYPCPEHTACPMFIGSITDEEADVMRAKFREFKKRFNEDFERRYEELFGEKGEKNV